MFDISSAASIGIIGGADGPTAVYLTTQPSVLGWILTICLFAAVVSAAIFIVRKILHRNRAFKD
jgi:Na+-transporting methylmalonyl-CoA/oxaloacetate decarboxylase beta subunit